MNMPMPKSIFLLSTLLFSGCLPGFVTGIPGSAKITTVKVEATGFTSVHQASVGSVNISLGEEESVSITTDDNLQQYLSATVENGELVIRTKGNESLAPTDGVKIDVKMKALTAIRLSGVGSITAENVKSPELTVKSDGVGSLKLAGEVDKLAVKVDGVGSFDSSKLDAKNVTVESNGVGSTKVKATESIDVKATGVGSVTYYGSPKEKKINASGIGSVSAAN
jgi:hypothetical protein